MMKFSKKLLSLLLCAAFVILGGCGQSKHSETYDSGIAEKFSESFETNVTDVDLMAEDSTATTEAIETTETTEQMKISTTSQTLATTISERKNIVQTSTSSTSSVHSETNDSTANKTTKKNNNVTYASVESYKSNVSNNYGYIAVWKTADFDGDGNNEAFVVTLNGEDIYQSTIKATLYVDHTGEITIIERDINNLVYDYSADISAIGGQTFFSVDIGAGGSGWLTLLYSVKNSKPYILDISQDLQGFYYEDGKFLTTYNDFDSGYHRYMYKELIYLNGQFTKGAETGREMEM